MNKSEISQLISTRIPYMKNMSSPKPDFYTVIKTSIPSITKHPNNICPNSKHNTNQCRVTFQPDISKSQLLSFLKNIYNFIKFNNQNSLKNNWIELIYKEYFYKKNVVIWNKTYK